MYAWILKNLEQLGSTGERIVLLGDSAGGNLVVAVALKVRTYVCICGVFRVLCNT